LFIQGGYLAAYTQYIDTSNTVNDRSIYYWIEEQNRTVPSDAGCLALIGCENIKAQNLKLIGNGQGILLFSTNNSTIIGNIIENNDMGIFALDSLNIIICKNVIAKNRIGIRLDGKFPVYSQKIVIHENNVINNDVGIHLYESSNNTICKNHIANNGYGISIIRLGGETDNNLIHHNNFINSSADVPGYWHMIVFEELWVPPPKNVWEYKNEGNYWSDYTARYLNATELDGLGVWDTPYVISDNNQDNYPLMAPVVISELPSPSHFPQPTLTPAPYQGPQQTEQFEIIMAVAVAVTIIGVGLGLLIYFKKKSSGQSPFSQKRP